MLYITKRLQINISPTCSAVVTDLSSTPEFVGSSPPCAAPPLSFGGRFYSYQEIYYNKLQCYPKTQNSE
jgi:hypothetical protein